MNILTIASGSTKTDYRKKKWGLSILIDKDVLFDTFCSGELLSTQFKRFKIDVSSIKHIIISHEHWDHINGLWWILEKNKNVSVYVCKKSSENFKNKVKAYGCTLIEVTSPMTIKENIFTTGEIEGTYNNKPIFEQSIIIKQQERLAVITGCSHPGILKILAYIGLEFKDDIDLLLGGLHLGHQPLEEIEKITTILELIYKINNIAPFHCTGNKAITYLENHIPHRFVNINTGACFHFNASVPGWKLIDETNGK